MQDLTITLVQTDQLWEDKEGNLNHFQTLLENCPRTDLILLPELFHTGFTMHTTLAEHMDDSLGLNWLQAIAKEKECALYTSLIIQEQDQVFNRGVFVQPNGEIHTYDKRKSFGLAGEDNYYTSGKTPRIVHWKGWNIQLQICYDLRFPEIVRNEYLEGQPAYDLIVYVANWPEKRSEHWKTLLRARAIENQCFVAGANRIGTDANNLHYTGDSCVSDALGQTHYCKAGQEEVYTVTLSKLELDKTREMLPFLKDR